MSEVEIEKAEKKKVESREVVDVRPDVGWTCPFCKQDNGLPEADVCGCGATFDAGTARR